MNNVQKLFNENKYIFSDFDGTISKFDVINAFITRFSKGDWSIAENLWCEGKLSTKDCIKIQFDLITELKRKDYEDFIDSVEIDPYFYDFYKYAKSLGKEIIIISDGFDVFISNTMKKFNMPDIKIYTNKLNITEKDGYLNFDMQYPNLYKECLIGSGCCKCEVARMYAQNYTYIGDGLSDRCIAKKSALLFAKKSLETFCKKENIPHISFKTFQDIMNAICKENTDANNDVGHINGICDKGI